MYHKQNQEPFNFDAARAESLESGCATSVKHLQVLGL